MSGIWRYKIETVPSDNGPLYVEVRVTSHGRDVLELTPYFDWNGKPPLVLRAQLKMGQKNVFRARVTARVRIVGEHRSEEVKTLLRDDGLGDPDIQRADGLYSAYFTHFRPGSNRYYFTFEASDNSGRAQVMTSAQRQPRIVPDEAYDQLHAEDTLPCCGSSTAGYSFVASGPFSRILPGPMIMYDHQASIIEDIYPPVRILDLTVEAATDLFRFSWTAPGADYHEGRAERYDFRFASFRINSSSFLEATPIALPEPLGAGEKEELVLKPGQIFQEQEITYGRIYYFAFRTFHGEWSPVSNIVRASLPFPPTEAPAPLPSENNKPAPPNHWTLAADPKQRSRLIMIIAACVGFVVIGTLVILCVTFCVKRRRKDVKPKDKNPDVIRSLATEDWEKGRVGNGSIHSNGSTPQKETPQYIGASQLLTTTYHHDQEYSVEHINQDLYCKTSNGSDPGSSNGGMQPYPPSYHSSTTGSANTGTTSGGLYRVNTPDPAMYLYQDYPELDARPKYVHFNDGWAPGSDKLPPPVPPKPSLYTGNDALVCQVPTGNVSILNNSSSNVLNDSRASMCSDHKKVRTVTQV
ncbi:unnamed protein product [Cyprideis torosa]|uniref:Uncharacterized protein n=1 Tax=Cyprideis torosa TaxID=163714 RepID=A0A7R8W3A3_9CRUS|nr:unnamed protein product [Cyprideis torosa]CAG0880620.1 unnamed protein product [Cyprideis torosa]